MGADTTVGGRGHGNSDARSEAMDIMQGLVSSLEYCSALPRRCRNVHVQVHTVRECNLKGVPGCQGNMRGGNYDENPRVLEMRCHTTWSGSTSRDASESQVAHT